MMKYSEWFSKVAKPDLNGVYQGRHSSKPDEIKYHLYKNGWCVGCDSAEDAAMMTEKFHLRLNSEFLADIFNMSATKNPIWEWRGLAEKPKGTYRFETSDKYKYWGATKFYENSSD